MYINLNYLLEYNALTMNAYVFIRSLQDEKSNLNSPVRLRNQKQEKTFFSNFKQALKKISTKSKNETFSYPSQNITSKRHKENNFEVESNEKNVVFHDDSKRIELSDMKLIKTDPNSSEYNSNRKLYAESAEMKNLEQENKNLKKNLEEINLLLSLKNKHIKKLESNLNQAKFDLSALQKFTDELKSHFDYFHKQNKELNEVKSMKFKNSEFYFMEKIQENPEILSQKTRKSDGILTNYFEISEESIVSSWVEQNKPFKFYMPKVTLCLSKKLINLQGTKSSTFVLETQIKNNTSDTFEEVSIKVLTSPSIHSLNIHIFENSIDNFLDIVSNTARYALKEIPTKKKERFEMFLENLNNFEPSYLIFKFSTT